MGWQLLVAFVVIAGLTLGLLLREGRRSGGARTENKLLKAGNEGRDREDEAYKEARGGALSRARERFRRRSD